MTGAAGRRAAELWLHDAVCHSRAAGNETDAMRADHARRTQGERAKELASATSLEELARIVHDGTCSMWAQQAHGAYYVDKAVRNCGPEGRDHIRHLMGLATITDLAEALGLAITD